MKKDCRHKWFEGAGFAAPIKLKNGTLVIKKIGTYIICDKCGTTIKAYDRKYL